MIPIRLGEWKRYHHYSKGSHKCGNPQCGEFVSMAEVRCATHAVRVRGRSGEVRYVPVEGVKAGDRIVI